MVIGRFIASGSGAPCHRCGKNIKVGADVYYATNDLWDDAGRTCGDCVTFDLFGGAA